MILLLGAIGSLLLLTPVVLAQDEEVLDMDGGISLFADTSGRVGPRIGLGDRMERDNFITPSAHMEMGFDEKYQRDYNIFNPINQYRPDNPLNPINSVDPKNPFNPVNEFDPGNPANPINRLNLNNPFNPINEFDPDNPLNPINRYNPNTPFKPLREVRPA
jgi:hypothetical protein